MYKAAEDQLKMNKPAEAEENLNNDEDDEIAQAEFEEQLLKKQAQSKTNPKIKRDEEPVASNAEEENSIDREDFERKLLEEHKQKQKMQRSNEPIQVVVYNEETENSPPKSALKQSRTSIRDDEKIKREKELKLLKQK